MQPHTSWGWHGSWVGGSMGKVSGEWMLGLTWLVAAQSAMASGWHALGGCVEGRWGLAALERKHTFHRRRT